IDVEQRADAEEVRRGLQDPALAPPAPLQVLEEAAVSLVARPQVLRLEPRLVAREVVAGLELEAQERVARDDEAFFRQPRAQLVDTPEARIQAVEPAQL